MAGYRGAAPQPFPHSFSQIDHGMLSLRRDLYHSHQENAYLQGQVDQLYYQVSQLTAEKGGFTNEISKDFYKLREMEVLVKETEKKCNDQQQKFAEDSEKMAAQISFLTEQLKSSEEEREVAQQKCDRLTKGLKEETDNVREITLMVESNHKRWKEFEHSVNELKQQLFHKDEHILQLTKEKYEFSERLTEATRKLLSQEMDVIFLQDAWDEKYSKLQEETRAELAEKEEEKTRLEEEIKKLLEDKTTLEKEKQQLKKDNDELMETKEKTPSVDQNEEMELITVVPQTVVDKKILKKQMKEKKMKEKQEKEAQRKKEKKERKKLIKKEKEEKRKAKAERKTRGIWSWFHKKKTYDGDRNTDEPAAAEEL